MGQESGCGLAGGLWLKFSHEAAAKVLDRGVISSKESTRAEGPNSKFTHAVAGRLQFFVGY
jgi:hypothetical protein